VLRGRGDPTLTIEDLWGLAAELRRSGVRVVRGDVVVDATFFDDDTEPPAFDQQPGERSYFRAPVGGVNVNRNVVTVFVRPAASAGRPAIVTSEPEGALAVVNDSVTVEGGQPAIRFSTREGDQGTRARVWGSVPVGDRGSRQRSRIDDPSLFAGAALAEALRYQGIRVQGQVRAGELPSSTRMLAHHRSEPLSSVLLLLGKQSDNFAAETVLKTLGAQDNAQGTWERAREAVRGWLESIGIPRDSYRLVNGSGLFDANRYSARQLATVLRAVWNDQTVRTEFVAQLATGGVDGTLSGRYREAPMLRNVRAKTGTLASVTALSGYVLAPSGRSTVAFSIMVNGARGVGRGRELQEQLVSATAQHLHRPAE
jgi:D-alanyl-D-alanine carboxypeptidase/D-alanyl-D-alanine-endopeptidase (penicillin-binding protein 4)